LKIKYINGTRLYRAFLAGAHQIYSRQDHLNKINVFPVPDADTGTNLSFTIRSIIDSSYAENSVELTIRSIADAALLGARGNSGVIFAQYLHGVAEEIGSRINLTTQGFGEAVKRAVRHAYEAMSSPQEGTMITVIREWAEAVYRLRQKTDDFVELLSLSIAAARKSLLETPQKLKVLARAGVVDAGAQGFVDFLEGISHFIAHGRLKDFTRKIVARIKSRVHVAAVQDDVYYRYCAEALIRGGDEKPVEAASVRRTIDPWGDSVIVAGSREHLKVHIHTDSPAEVFEQLRHFGTIIQQKVDDLKMQYMVNHQRKSNIALVTDSTCDLPRHVLDEYQIQVVPVKLNIGDSSFLDKLTITPDQFYGRLDDAETYPTTSQPAVQDFQNMFSYLSDHYDSIIALQLSGGLSGTFSSARTAANNLKDKKITVIDSKSISVGLGLLVLRAAESIRAGKSHEEVVSLIRQCIPRTRLFVTMRTMKYLIRSGRVSPMTGFIANLLHLRPIISLNAEGKTFKLTQASVGIPSMKKVVARVKQMMQTGSVWNYAVAHARAPFVSRWYEKSLSPLLQRQPLCNLEISPVIGLHAGIGTAGVAIMME
jgi:DegV family protein with EDD domain